VEENKNSKKGFWYMPLAYIPVILLIAGLLVWKRFAPQPLPVFATVPPFHFTAENGKAFDSGELAGRVWVADFFYSTCHTSCPIQTADMGGLQKEWKDRSDFNLVSFTLDPKDDTAPVLAKYARDYQADVRQWFFLTGDRKDLYDLAEKGFKVTAREDNSSAVPGFIHSTRLILVDRKGRIRGYYNVLQDSEVKQLGRDLKRLLGSKV
jgi:protein SCO1